MRKYWAIFKLNWQNSVEYRVDFFGHLLTSTLSLLATLFIFRAIFKQTSNFGGYTFPLIFTYLVMTKFLHFATRGNTSRYIADEIKTGQLSTGLIKPINYIKYWFSLFLADRFFEIVIRAILIVAFILFFPPLFKLPAIGSFFLFTFSIVLALILNFVINVIIATFAFWVTDIRLFSSALGLTIDFFAGAVVPLDVLPGILKNVSSFLPFQYAIFFPIKIFQGSLSPASMVNGFLSTAGWIVLLIFLSRIFWQKGIKRYEGIGQ